MQGEKSKDKRFLSGGGKYERAMQKVLWTTSSSIHLTQTLLPFLLFSLYPSTL